MKPFYEELKALREKKEIDLDQIQSRTKINRRFLEAIENGDFDVLPLTYVKLFLRAYVIEIGGEPEEVLNQLDHHLNQTLSIPGKEVQVRVEETQGIQETDISDKSGRNLWSFTNIKVRSKLVKGVLLLILWFFIIYVIKQISADGNGTNGSTRVNPTEVAVGSIITDEVLATGFVVLSSSEELIEAAAPFSVKIVTTEALGYQVKVDASLPRTVFLPSGDQETVAFEKMLDLLLNQSTGVNIFINGKSIPRLKLQTEPVRITFTSDPLRISIKHFTKLE